MKSVHLRDDGLYEAIYMHEVSRPLPQQEQEGRPQPQKISYKDLTQIALKADGMKEVTHFRIHRSPHPREYLHSGCLVRVQKEGAMVQFVSLIHETEEGLQNTMKALDVPEA